MLKFDENLHVRLGHTDQKKATARVVEQGRMLHSSAFLKPPNPKPRLTGALIREKESARIAMRAIELPPGVAVVNLVTGTGCACPSNKHGDVPEERQEHPMPEEHGCDTDDDLSQSLSDDGYSAPVSSNGERSRVLLPSQKEVIARRKGPYRQDATISSLSLQKASPRALPVKDDTRGRTGGKGEAVIETDSSEDEDDLWSCITDPSLKQSFMLAHTNVCVFLSSFTRVLNESIDAIIQDGTINDAHGNEYRNSDMYHDDEETERFFNAPKLVLPVLSQINNQLAVLGVRKMQYERVEKIALRPEYAVSDLVNGILESVLSAIDEEEEKQLYCVMTGVRNEIVKHVTLNMSHARYCFLVPVFYFDVAGQRVNCIVHVIHWVIDRMSLRIMTCGQRKEKEEVEARIAIDSFGLGLHILNRMLEDLENVNETAEAWINANEKALKLGQMFEEKKEVKEIPRHARDQLQISLQ